MRAQEAILNYTYYVTSYFIPYTVQCSSNNTVTGVPLSAFHIGSVNNVWQCRAEFATEKIGIPARDIVASVYFDTQ